MVLFLSFGLVLCCDERQSNERVDGPADEPQPRQRGSGLDRQPQQWMHAAPVVYDRDRDQRQERSEPRAGPGEPKRRAEPSRPDRPPSGTRYGRGMQRPGVRMVLRETSGVREQDADRQPGERHGDHGGQKDHGDAADVGARPFTQRNVGKLLFVPILARVSRRPR